jgi:SAM-dependent methyltransferase
VSEARQKVSAKELKRELLPNQSKELLQTLHLVTRDGELNADARRKLKQVNHLIGLLQPALDDLAARAPGLTVVDVGSGNSYLGFILYELFFKGRPQGDLYAVEYRTDLTQKSAERAKALGYERMHFEAAAISQASYPERLGLLTALHACDTATDDALYAAISHRADYVAVVPCCQAEVAQLLKESRAQVGPAMQALFSHPWHRREFGSHLTNVLRALVLEAQGYQVTVTELAGWEHSLKNELILGKRLHGGNPEAKRRLQALLEVTGVKPRLVRLLEGAGS